MLYIKKIRFLILGAGLLVLGLAGLGVSPAAAAPAPQAGTGTVSGRSLSQDNVPLAGNTISAYTQPGSVQDRAPVAQTTTAADGTYTLTVPAGTVWINIAPIGHWPYDYTPIQLNAGDQITGIDFVVAIRVLPTSVPEATAVPPTAVAEPATPTPIPPPVGMPVTGGPAAIELTLPVLLLLAGLLLAATGWLIRWSRRGGQENPT
jgi:hypothetical protein